MTIRSNRYRIMNLITKQRWEGEANSAQEACQKAGWPIKVGWPIEDCWVRQYSPKGSGGWRKPDELKPRNKPQGVRRTTSIARK